MKRVKIIVSGNVQGVGYRHAARNVAEEIGVYGYVMNLYNGDVELVVEGEDSAVARMILWSNQGPYGAEVSDQKIEEQSYQGEFQDFTVKHSW